MRRPGLLPLDTLLGRALAARPAEVPVLMAFDNHQPSMTGAPRTFKATVSIDI